VAMRDPSSNSPNYCDLSYAFDPGFGGGVCTEFDLLEADNTAFSSNLHTRRGEGHDGSCNSWGCNALLGPKAKYGSDRNSYGLGEHHSINTERPFGVSVAMDAAKGLRIQLTQGRASVIAFDRSKAGNPIGRGVPMDAISAMQAAMGSFVLVASLWSTGKVT
jgi:hypothetical protein